MYASVCVCAFWHKVCVTWEHTHILSVSLSLSLSLSLSPSLSLSLSLTHKHPQPPTNTHTHTAFTLYIHICIIWNTHVRRSLAYMFFGYSKAIVEQSNEHYCTPGESTQLIRRNSSEKPWPMITTPLLHPCAARIKWFSFRGEKKKESRTNCRMANAPNTWKMCSLSIFFLKIYF